MSNYYLDSVYSIEHIIPFSSIWSKTIDINRLGNLFPTLDIINKTRGNKNLDIYFEDDNRHFTRFIQDLLPIENYNEICSFPAATTAFAAATSGSSNSAITTHDDVMHERASRARANARQGARSSPARGQGLANERRRRRQLPLFDADADHP